MQIIQLPLRGAQFLFCLPVLGMTAWIISDHGPFGVAAITDYVVFCGAFGLVASVVGIAAAFTPALQGIVIIVVDALAVVFFLASSIALAVQTGVASCDPGLFDGDRLPARLWVPGMISNGYWDSKSYEWIAPYSGFVTRCRMSQANDAFLFFALAVFIASLIFDIFSGRKGNSGSVV